MRTRLDLLARLPKHSVGAELGVFAGDFSQQILDIVQPSALFLVDHFAGLVSSGDEHGHNVRTVNMGAMLGELRQRFALANVYFARADSAYWLASRPADSLDWVYIDTDHSYGTTQHELATAFDAVKAGGFICGHDYDPQYPGVVQAVQEFCRAYGYAPDFTTADGLASYLIQI